MRAGNVSAQRATFLQYTEATMAVRGGGAEQGGGVDSLSLGKILQQLLWCFALIAIAVRGCKPDPGVKAPGFKGST